MNRSTSVFSSLSEAPAQGMNRKCLSDWLWAYSIATIGYAQKKPEKCHWGLKNLKALFTSPYELPADSELFSLKSIWPSPDALTLHPMPILPPVLAGTAWVAYQNATDKEAIKPLLEDIYTTALEYHRQLYALREHQDSGLIIIKNEWETFYKEVSADSLLLDPFFHALLSWSNAALIQLGGFLNKDVLEIMEWYELTIYSANEYMWSDSYEGYYPIALDEEQLINVSSADSALALFGNLATQDQAEVVYPHLENQLKDHFQQPKDEKQAGLIDITRLITLMEGTSNYDFEELNLLLIKELAIIFNAFGTQLSEALDSFIFDGLKSYME